MLPRFEHHFSSDHIAGVPGYTGGDYDEISDDQFDDIDGPPEASETPDQPEAYHVAKTDAEAPGPVQPPQEGGAEIPVPVEDEPESCLATSGQPVGAQPPGEESAEGSPEQQADEKRTSNLDPAPAAAGGGGGRLPEKPPGSSTEDGGEAYRAEVVEYLQKLREGDPPPVGKPTTIPTVNGSMQFIRADRDWFTARGEGQYKCAAFADQFEPAPAAGARSSEVTAALRPDQSAVTAGGINSAFAPGSVVLDLGSGEAAALHQLAQEFPETIFWGIDDGYSEERALQADKPGLQLSKGDWRVLENVPTESVDTIISCLGPMTWELRDVAFIDALSRVAKTGAVLRFNAAELLPADDDPPTWVAAVMARTAQIFAALENNGWTLELTGSTEDPGSIVGVKGERPVIAGGSGPLEPNGREESGANQARREYEAAAAEYIQHARETPLRLMQREVIIPTPDGPIAYGAPEHPSQDYAIRSGDQYRKMAFGDEFVAVTEDDEEYEGEKTAVKRREDQSGVVAGGIERALGSGQVVIDLGCGHAIADHELAADYPLATIIGIDRNLKEVRDIDVDKPGLQLTQGNWDTLDGIPDGKATVVVSVGAAEAWGEIRRDGGPDFISAVHRVTAPGAVFRFHFPGQERFTQIEERLHALGWVVDRRQYTVIAVKPGP